MKINNTLYTNGGRKYVSENERKMLICAARNSHGSVRTLVETLTYTGCRISEALALTADHIDMENQEIRFETLKKLHLISGGVGYLHLNQTVSRQ